MGKSFSWEQFDLIPVVGILRNFTRQQTEHLAIQYGRSGLNTLEITMNSPDAPGVIAHLVETLGHRLNIGAGTVCTSRDLDLALAAGAQFIVTPILDEEVIRTCVKKEVPVFPGAYTPTEIYRAWSLGASMVKVFPATQLGAGYIREVLAPLPAIKLMPTGGVSPDNFADFLRAGARGLGMGTQLFPKQLIAEGRWEELGEFFSRFVKAYCDFKEQKTTQQQ